MGPMGSGISIESFELRLHAERTRVEARNGSKSSCRPVPALLLNMHPETLNHETWHS